MLCVLLYLDFSTLLLLNDLQTAWIELTFSIYLHTRVQIHYFDALSDPDLPTHNCCILYSTQKLSKQELDNRLIDWPTK